MKKLLRSLAAVAIAAAASGAAVVGLAGTAFAGTNPPWEPIGNPPEAGSLSFFDSNGLQIIGGSLTAQPLAAFVQGSATLRTGDTKATLFGYLPVNGQSPGAWSGEALSASTTFPNTSAPGSLGTSSLPLVTGGSGDESIATLESDFPNTDTSTTDGYGGAYVLRLKTSATGLSPTTSYDSADITVNSSAGTWSVDYPVPTPSSTTTTLTPSPASPQVSGTNVTLQATVSPPVPGTVQFEVGGSDIGSPVTVSAGAASLSTTTLPTGSDSLSAVFTPAQFYDYTGSTGTASFTITGAPATAAFCTSSNARRPLTQRMQSDSGTRFSINAQPITLSIALWRPTSSRRTSNSPAVLNNPAACIAPVRLKAACDSYSLSGRRQSTSGSTAQALFGASMPRTRTASIEALPQTPQLEVV